ncbi:hypothetical protein C7271_13580 [filamentous cyanobacterium CCP5]|nr:hypothetical protein C7271_13580 [filamentous cyanobacterium CCP5]
MGPIPLQQSPSHQGRFLTAIAALVLITLSGCTVPSDRPETSSESTPGTAAAPAQTGDLPENEAILQTVYDQIEALDLCDGTFQPEPAAGESQVYPMDDQALVELLCATTAYQLVYAYVVYHSDGSLEPLSLDVFYPDSTGEFVRASQAVVAGLADFEPNTGLLTIFSKGRGLADCGSLAEYRWTGRELALELYRYKECDTPDGEFVEPADYPQIYP